MPTQEQKDLTRKSITPALQDRSRTDANRAPYRRQWDGPFDFMRQFAEQFDRWPLAGLTRQPGSGFVTRPRGVFDLWSPQVETFQRADEFVVRADLPGLQKKDITVEVKDDALVIQGERSNDYEDSSDGHYTSERSYGQFCRVVPLPEGAIGDSVKASFKNGVLEVVMKAPPHEATRGRKVEISEGSADTKR